MSNPSWTREQEQCIFSHNGTLLVSAAAGSGKTTVLVERILQRITDPDHPLDLDRLLVVTFTKAAAAEMRQRLSKRLSGLAAEHPDDLRLSRQLLILPRASICTIDSFCANLVRENFHALGISPQFKIADEQQLTLLRHDALQETLQEFYEDCQPDFLELSAMLSNGKNDARLFAAVDTVYTFIQSYPEPERWLCSTAALYDDTQPIAETLWGKAVLSHIAGSLERCASLCHTAIALCAQDDILRDNYTPALSEDAATIARLQEAAQNGEWNALFDGLAAFSGARLAAAKGCTRDDLKQRIGDLRTECKAALKKLAALDCGTAEQCRADITRSARLIRVLYNMVRRYTVLFSEKKHSANLLDFGDVEHFALQLLTTCDETGKRIPTPLARELSERLDEILVDEYQDTNAVQDALFVALSRNEQNLFLVGDVKQSIYAFRKAMPALFIGRRDAYPPFDGKQYPATVTLGNNFRSRRTVTDAVNFLFGQLMTREVGGITYDEREKLVCSATYPEPDSTAHETECLIVDGTSYDRTQTDKDTAEARVIAARIQNLKNTFTVTEKGETRPFCYKDCCILLRSHKTHAAAYRDTLLMYGIPAVAATNGGFFETPEIRITLSLLRCIDNPLQDIPLAAVMLSPVFGFSTDDLARIRLVRPRVPLYVAVTAARREAGALGEQCRAFVETLNRYRSLSALLTVDRLLNRLYEELSLPELLCARTNGETRAENLRLLYEQCTGFEQKGFRGLSAFIRHIDRLLEQHVELAGASAATSDDAVQILSVHSSKGLEYPVVFVAGLGNEFNRESTKADLLLHAEHGAGMNLRDSETLTRHVTLPKQGLALLCRQDERAEELRILYVAMTRAREKLILVTTQKDPARRLTSLGASLSGAADTLPPYALCEAASLSDWVLSALLRHPSGDELRRLAGLDNTVVLPDTAHWHISLCTPPDLIPITRAEDLPAAADTRLVTAIRENMAYTYPHLALAATPTKLAASEIAADPTEPKSVAHARPSFLNSSGLTPAERGTAMHSFMQFADYTAAAASTVKETQRLVSHGFLSAEQAASLDHRRLTAFFKSDLYRRLCASPRVLREYRFTYREQAAALNPTLTDETDGIVIQGIADCVFEENGKLVIVDYKTDHVRTPEELTERYRAQLGIYAKALHTVLALPVGETVLYSFALNSTIIL